VFLKKAISKKGLTQCFHLDCREGTVFGADPWGYTYCHISNCLQDVLDEFCIQQTTCPTSKEIFYNQNNIINT
jgi:hypothetical protein